MATRKAKAKSTAASQSRARPKSAARKTSGSGKVALLSGGNPQIAKGVGDGPVQAYIAAMPGWKREIGRRLDAVVMRTIPTVRKAVKYKSPLYGAAGRDDWFIGVHCMTRYVKVAFFHGAALDPKPPGESKQKYVRYLDIREEDAIDEKQLASWIRQASKLRGEKL